MDNESIEVIKRIAPMLYEDGARPAVKEAGKILADAISFIGIPFSGMKYLSQKANLYFDNHLKNYSDKLDKVPHESKCEPMLEISVPILQKLYYTTSDEIAKLFNSLLVGASDLRQQQNVFPSFCHIVSQLSVDEARIIKYLKGKDAIGFCVLTKEGLNHDYDQIRFYVLQKQVDFMFENNMEFYLDDLERLGILRSESFATSIQLPEFDEIPKFYNLDEVCESGKQAGLQMSVSNHAYYVTDFGEAFINACTYDPSLKAEL